jgi:hypothetical protein
MAGASTAAICQQKRGNQCERRPQRHHPGRARPAACDAPLLRKDAVYRAYGIRRAAARREFGGASAAYVAPTLETASAPSSTSREFSRRRSAAEDEFGG